MLDLRLGVRAGAQEVPAIRRLCQMELARHLHEEGQKEDERWRERNLGKN